MNIRVIAILAAAWMLTATAQAAPTPTAPLADRLPAGALIYAGWAGRSLTFDGSMFGQLLNDPDIAKIVRAFDQAIRADVSGNDTDGKKIVGSFSAMLSIAWQHPVAAALLDLQKGPNGPEPSAVLLIDLGNDRDAFARHLDTILTSPESKLTITEATIDQVSYRTVRLYHGPEVTMGYIDNVFFLGVGNETPKAVIEKAATEKLSADKKFADCLRAVADGDVQAAYYLDVSGLATRLQQFVPAPSAGGEQADQNSPIEKIRSISAALGLDKVSAAASATTVIDRGLYSRTRIFTPAPHRGLLRALAGPEVTDADLASVPEDADLLLAAKLSPQAAWDELRQAIRQADARADKEITESLADLEEHLGVSLSKDVLSQLGDGWVLSSAPSRGGFLTGTMLSVDVKDPAKLSASIAKIEAALLPPPQAAKGADGSADAPASAPADSATASAPQARPAPTGPKIEALTFERTKIHYLALPSEYDVIPVAPAWAVHKDHLLVAAWPQIIQSAIAANPAAKSVTQSADFRTARQRIKGKPSVILYCNGPKVARQMYHWFLVGWTGGANKIAASFLPAARPAWLPPLSTVERYLRPSIVAVSPDAGGIDIESYGSLPSAAPLAGVFLNQVPLWLSATKPQTRQVSP